MVNTVSTSWRMSQWWIRSTGVRHTSMGSDSTVYCQNRQVVAVFEPATIVLDSWYRTILHCCHLCAAPNSNHPWAEPILLLCTRYAGLALAGNLRTKRKKTNSLIQIIKRWTIALQPGPGRTPNDNSHNQRNLLTTNTYLASFSPLASWQCPCCASCLLQRWKAPVALLQSSWLQNLLIYTWLQQLVRKQRLPSVWIVVLSSIGSHHDLAWYTTLVRVGCSIEDGIFFIAFQKGAVVLHRRHANLFGTNEYASMWKFFWTTCFSAEAIARMPRPDLPGLNRNSPTREKAGGVFDSDVIELNVVTT